MQRETLEASQEDRHRRCCRLERLARTCAGGRSALCRPPRASTCSRCWSSADQITCTTWCAMPTSCLARRPTDRGMPCSRPDSLISGARCNALVEPVNACIARNAPGASAGARTRPLYALACSDQVCQLSTVSSMGTATRTYSSLSVFPYRADNPLRRVLLTFQDLTMTRRADVGELVQMNKTPCVFLCWQLGSCARD